MAQADVPHYELMATSGHALGWSLYVGPEDGHIIPDNDTFEHILDEACGCHPIDNHEVDDYIWGHRALDGREAYEKGIARLN